MGATWSKYSTDDRTECAVYCRARFPREDYPRRAGGGLYEQGRVRHLGVCPRLEDQMCAFARDAHGTLNTRSAGYSPDRVGALVWALTDLLLEQVPGEGIYEVYCQLIGQLGGRRS